MPRTQRLYSLRRPKLRQSWNKYNLFNLFRRAGAEPQIKGTPTFFQQKWQAKSKTRSYHGEHIPEKKWVRMFSPRLLSAVDMPAEYLAAHDGSEQATGRGSGTSDSTVKAESFSKAPRLKVMQHDSKWPDINGLLLKNLHKTTPYMQMTFAPLERRLDVAIFRAMFASSTRQARQFVIHGAVKVNGKKVVHPSYMLNPGDMFQVEVDKVLYGTGEQKKPNEHSRLRENLEARRKRADALFKNTASATSATGDSSTAENESGDGSTPHSDAAAVSDEPASAEERWKANNKALKALLKTVRSILDSNQNDLKAKEKKMLRLFRTEIRRFLSLPEGSQVDPEELLKDLQMHMRTHELSRLKFENAESQEDATAREPRERESRLNRQKEIDRSLGDLSAEQKQKAERIMGSSTLSRDEMRKLGWLLKMDEENPIDDTKPYATPWRPRPFMGAFAFIPRYLEVNPNICAAIYLRHPLARKGMAEVPTPFSYLTSQLAHSWYLQRG